MKPPNLLEITVSSVDRDYDGGYVVRIITPLGEMWCKTGGLCDGKSGTLADVVREGVEQTLESLPKAITRFSGMHKTK